MRGLDEHSQYRIYMNLGVKVVQRFGADESYNEPDSVVRQFLGLVKRS